MKIRVRDNEDSFCKTIYIEVGPQTYKSLYVDTQHGHVMEGISSERVAGRWPVVWESA